MNREKSEVLIVPSEIIPIALPTPYPVGDVNAYFIDGPEPTLIDAGVFSSYSLKALSERLAEKGKRIEDIRRILITHGHYDHAGASAHLSKLCRAELYTHEKCTLPELRGPEEMAAMFDYLTRCGVPGDILTMVGQLFEMGRKFLDRESAPHAVVRLKGGEHIVCGALTVEAINTPGHAPDHLCWLHRESGVVFTGDMLLLKVTPNPMLHLDPLNRRRRSRSLVLYLESLDRLEASGALYGLAGHGAPIADVPALIARNRRFILQRKQRFLDQLQIGPAGPYALARAVFGNLDPINLVLAVSETLAHLDLLELDGGIEVDWEEEAITARVK